ncbi:MAG TPA: glycosyltransferase, partial [Candidatus Omnitrophota bacterium]|nr:glycosyltransferase [Candidatus Omnitrophota bacterium]
KYLSARHTVHLLSFIESEEEEKYLGELGKYCARIETVLLKPSDSYAKCLLLSPTAVPFQVAYYRDGRMREKADNMMSSEKYDGIYVHLLRMAQYARGRKDTGRVLDLTDSLSLSLYRSLKYRKHLFYLFYLAEWLKVRRYEPEAVSSFDRALLISDADLRSEKALASEKNISIIPNGVDLGYFKPSSGGYDDNKIVFIGNLHSFPNRDAVLYFHGRIFPAVKKARPGAVFYIVGSNPPEKIRKLADGRSVFVTGPVEDTRAHLGDAAALVCPIRAATGMQNKVMEAMAMGLPVVSTAISTQWMLPGREAGVLTSDSPEGFAGNVVKIMEDRALRERLSRMSRRYAEENFRWEDNIKDLERIFEEGINR